MEDDKYFSASDNVQCSVGRVLTLSKSKDLIRPWDTERTTDQDYSCRFLVGNSTTNFKIISILFYFSICKQLS